jgi:hypothetical protein
MRIPGHVNQVFRSILNQDSGHVNQAFRQKVNTKPRRIGIFIHMSEWFSKETFI